MAERRRYLEELRDGLDDATEDDDLDSPPPDIGPDNAQAEGGND